MIPLGMALVWAGYAIGLEGWILVRGYNVKFTQIISPTNYLKQPIANWPKLPPGYNGMFPSGGGTSAPSSGTQKKPPPGPRIA